jgi:2-polyprenyl-3-methyl-5-hydroxy-6-metoxy-1,4-benzoquinol methylase
MPNVEKIREIQQRMIGLCRELEQCLVANEVTQQTTTMTKVNVEDSLENFESLKRALFSERWPEATNPNMICNPDCHEEKMERGRGIVEMVVEDSLKNKRFLDYGCGEGFCAFIASEYQPAISVGFDIKDHEIWKRHKSNENLTFTSSIEEARSHGPYDTILMYDVLDHIVGEDPVALLIKAKELLSPNGKIYLRNHPFISRHGTHLYHELNKAFIHLVFTAEEIKQLIPNSKYQEPSIGVTAPIVTYEHFANKARLKISKRRELTERVEPFFRIPKIAERIMKNLNKTSFPEYQMSILFIDMTLQH